MSESDATKRFIGIDLGTTYSAVAWLDPHGTPVTLPNAEDEPTTPSVVLFEETGEVVVGRQAKRAALVVPDRVADYVKRDMGQTHYHKRLNYRFFSPASISALILKKLKQDAEARIGPIAGAVITVPAYFDEKRRRATAAAGEIAGLSVIDILNEPTAAALAYAFRDFVLRGGRPDDALGRAIATTAPHTAVVYDLGGGTFDVTVLRIAGDDLTVLATDGDARLGGRDWDDRIVDWAARLFKRQHRSDPRNDPQSHQNLLLAAEEAKRDLSRLPKARLLVTHAGRNLALELPRDGFDQLTADLLDRTRQRVSEVIEQAGLNWGQVHEVLAVGGSTRMPQVLRMLREVTGKEPNCSLPPGEAVAQGAAIHAAIKAVDLWDAAQARASAARAARRPELPPFPSADEGTRTTPLEEPAAPYGPPPVPQAPGEAASPPDDPAFPRASGEVDGPSAFEDIDDGPGNEPQSGNLRDRLLAQVLDDETIDLGLGCAGDLAAAPDPAEQFEAGVGQTLRRFRKTDVNAHTLGVAVTRQVGGRGKSVLVARNTPLPASTTKVYGTLRDNQPEVVITILEGESPYVDACSVLGTCRIKPLPLGLPKGSPVEVTFTLDQSGRLHVKAVEQSTGRYVTTTIFVDSGMSPEKIASAKNAVQRISVL